MVVVVYSECLGAFVVVNLFWFSSSEQFVIASHDLAAT
jgi:hypothetical protein